MITMLRQMAPHLRAYPRDEVNAKVHIMDEQNIIYVNRKHRGNTKWVKIARFTRSDEARKKIVMILRLYLRLHVFIENAG